MPSLVKAISVQWDLWIEQYRAYFPVNKEEVQDCLQLLHEAGTLDGASAENGFDPAYSLLAACQDTRTGEIIACMRLSDALKAKALPEKAEQYRLNLFDERQLPSIVIFSQLAIHPAHQKTQAMLVLLSHCFIESLKAGGQAALMSCDPGFFSIYKRLGMRPVGQLGKTPDGYFRIPMICLPDQDYLSIINSPVLPLLREVDFDLYQPFCQWYYQLVRENSALQVGSAFFPENAEDFSGGHAVTEGLTEKGREAFMKNAQAIICQEGEVLITENEGGKSFGYVRKGIVNVEIGGKTVVILGEGDIFGEIAYILSSKRTANVVAASPDTEVVIFSESAVNSLEEESDRTAIWRNLARVAARRVVLTNKLLG